MSFDIARRQRQDSLLVNEFNRVAAQIAALGKHELHKAEVLMPTMRLLSTIGWRLLNWHILVDHMRIDIDLIFASPEYFSRHAAWSYNESLVRRFLKIEYQTPDAIADAKPLRTVFKTSTVRQKKLRVRWL